MSAQVFTLLALCAVLLLLGGGLLFVAVVVLAFLFKGGGDADAGVSPSPMAAPVVPATSPSPIDPERGLDTQPPVPKAADPYVSLEEEDGKTEVFMRGSLNVDWDEEDEEGEATEIFRPDVHGGFNVE